MTPEQALQEIKDLAENVFRPRAEAADREKPGPSGIVAENIRLLADCGYFGLGIDPRYGGMGADDWTRREFTEIVASACGVTAFTQQQFHSGGGFAGSSLSGSLKEELLPRLASGESICGVAFSHLRRRGKPLVTARAVDGGFIVNGKAPWVTGWSFIDGFTLGATVDLPGEASEGQHLFAYVPLAGNEAALKPGPPIELHVMTAADTVEVDVRDLFVPMSHVIGVRPAEDLRRNDYCGISGHVFLPLGCARGSIHYLRELAATRHNDKLIDIADVFEREVDACRREALTWNGSCADMPDYKEHALGARTWAIELAVRAAHAAVAATGGTGQIIDRAPQRLMREAVFYTTLAQTPDVQAGTLERLTNRN
jgi:alkylation response protein AidB-like acyl-CoA dehydrogenase